MWNDPLHEISRFDVNLKRQRMTLPTADMRLRDVSLRLFTERRDLDAALKTCGEGPDNRGFQPEILAGICTRNSGHRAGLAQIARPALSRGLEQSALLYIATTKIISIKVRAFSAGWGSHFFYYRP